MRARDLLYCEPPKTGTRPTRQYYLKQHDDVLNPVSFCLTNSFCLTKVCKKYGKNPLKYPL